MPLKINYVVATYSGVIKSRDEKEQYALQVNLNNLHHILKENKTCISQVTVVCPTPRGDAYPNYYQQKKWEKRIPNIVFLPYEGRNDHHSYDQWLQGYLKFPDFDYYIFIEDDYCVNTDIPNFDTKLVEIYKESFPDNIGYLCSKADVNEHRFHAIVSNGMISRESLEKFDKKTMLQELYSTTTYESYPYPQLKFSFMFLNKGIPLKDYRKYYSVPFWDSYSKQTLEYGNGNLPAIIYPTQNILYSI